MPKKLPSDCKEARKTNNSNDYYFRILLCFISAYVITMYNEDIGFYEAILTKPTIYVRSLAASFIIAFLLTGYIGYISTRLDQKFDWYRQTVWRILWQFILGYLVPAVSAFLLVAGYFAMYGFNILATNYLREDYTLVLLMLVVFNLFVTLLSFFRRGEATSVSAGVLLSVDEKEEAKVWKEVLIVDTPLKSIAVRTEDISYIFILRGAVFLRTSDMAALSDSYQISMTLKELEEELDPFQFFRINRQMVISFNSFVSFRPSSAKNIELTLKPLPYPTGVKVPAEHKRLTIVSEDRTTYFKRWIER